MFRRNWNREELIAAFNLYCKTPFGRIHISNPAIVELARLLGRTPSAVSWKLANFARLDPSLKKRNIAGAAHGARAELEIWNEFNGNWEKLAFESERLMEQKKGLKPGMDASIELPEGFTRETIIRARVNQAFFRAAVLAAYDGRCCITGLSIPELLIASHIVPWSVDVKNRTNPRNGFCLNALHDRAFDSGLITVTTALQVKISPRLKKHVEMPVCEFLTRFDGAPVAKPRQFAPDATFLRYHNEQVFLDS